MAPPPNIILIVLDTFRNDGIKEKHDNKLIMNTLNEIIKESIYYSNAFSNAPWTIPAHASIFTGLYPTDHNATHITKRLNSNVITIAEILKKKGYSTIGVCENSWINKQTGLTRGFDAFYGFRDICSNLFFVHTSLKIKKHIESPFIYLNRFILDKSKTELSIETAMKLIKNSRKPFFLFLNLIECHLPYYPSKKYVKRFSNVSKKVYREWKEKRSKQWVDGNGFTYEEFDIFKTLYKSSLQCIDENLGNFIHFLKEEGILQNSILIITSDHGENIGDHNLIGHQFSLHDSLIKVPIIICNKNTMYNGYINNNLVETRDICNTILAAINMKQEYLLDEKFNRKFIIGEYYEPTAMFTKISDSEIGEKFKGKTTYLRVSDYKYIYNNRWQELWKCSDENEYIVDDKETMKMLQYLLFRARK